MTPRHQEVLHGIVEAYIATGEPVASRSIVRRRGGDLSAASIRNVMADLDEEGFLSQPHTSAGRIPTQKAFRSHSRESGAGPNRARGPARQARAYGGNDAGPPGAQSRGYAGRGAQLG